MWKRNGSTKLLLIDITNYKCCLYLTHISEFKELKKKDDQEDDEETK